MACRAVILALSLSTDHVFRIFQDLRKIVPVRRSDADSASARLGWEAGILNNPGGQPKGMHWKILLRLITTTMHCCTSVCRPWPRDLRSQDSDASDIESERADLTIGDHPAHLTHVLWA